MKNPFSRYAKPLSILSAVFLFMAFWAPTRQVILFLLPTGLRIDDILVMIIIVMFVVYFTGLWQWIGERLLGGKRK